MSVYGYNGEVEGGEKLRVKAVLLVDCFVSQNFQNFHVFLLFYEKKTRENETTRPNRKKKS